MTDDESRKAYFAVPDLGSPIPPTPWEIWQAAVEFATKMERERCVNEFCDEVNRVAGIGGGWERLSAFLDRMTKP